MKASKVILPIFSIFAALLLLIFPASSAASIGNPDTRSFPRALKFARGDCACDSERAELVAHRDRIAESATLEEAQTLALVDVGLARKAISRAKWIMPRSQTLRNASERLESYEVSVEGAQSQQEVAEAFANLVRLASADELQVVDVGLLDKEGCEFTTGEIIVIIIGLVFGIIPGLIFLAIFC